MATPISLHALYAPKEGNTEEQYEDAFAHSPLEDPATLTVVVADGASSAVFAREWATLLATTFAANPFPATDAEMAKVIGALGKDWRADVEKKATTWWAQEKLPNGSSATLLVVTWNRETLTWEARSIGDVCIFLIRNNRLRFAFPLTKSTKFDDRPALVSTEVGKREKLPKVTRYVEKYEEGDRFLMMTDALSAFFLTEFETKRKPWNDLPDSLEKLLPWLKTHRDSGSLKNDDVTLVDVRL